MTREEAFDVLKQIKASPRLVRHAELVLEAGEALIDFLEELNVAFDRELIRVGIILHDAGKTLHPEELTGSGSEHEEAGERMLLERGVDPAIARCCRSHARWFEMDCTLEELVVALADKLWKGNRDGDLELTTIDRLAQAIRVERWDLILHADSTFEAIAASWPERLLRG
ncbi:MAG: HD domain-containing protein [Planctomycetaceae bacterium]|nr:HD domain-containing protein [Planctomycetaceae bacterium]